MPDFFSEHFIKIVIGVIAVIVWIIGKIKESQAQKEETWEPREEDYLPEDYQPAQPPPLYPTTGSAPPPLPSTYVAADDSELERQRKMQERLRSIRDKKGPTPKPAVSKRVAKPKPQTTTTLVSPSKVRDRLRDRKELRRAIVMNEILNPPVSLR